MPSRVPRHISAHSFPPSPTKETFRDILVFEERLKQNAELLGRQRRKYEAFLGTLVCAIVTLAYKVFVTPSRDSPIAYVYMGSLLVTLTMLALFFATGMYSEKIARGYKFIPQANRSIRTLNVHLNSRSYSLYSPRYLFPRLYAYFRPDPRPQAAPTTQSAPPSPARSVRQQRVPLEPIPPSSNPRGELIFSNKVGSSFREGYVKYRAEWEDRRRRRMRSASGAADKRSSSSSPGPNSVAAPSTSSNSSSPATWNLFSQNKESYSSSLSSRSPSPAVRHRRTLSSSSTTSEMEMDEERSRRLSTSTPSPLHLNPPD